MREMQATTHQTYILPKDEHPLKELKEAKDLCAGTIVPGKPHAMGPPRCIIAAALLGGLNEMWQKMTDAGQDKLLHERSDADSIVVLTDVMKHIEAAAKDDNKML